VLSGKLPYRDFSLEYPPGALPAFVIPSLGPAADYDSWFMAFEAACGLACVALVGAASRSRSAAAYCALAPLALGSLALHRYDLWATALATAGVVALLARQAGTGFAALGAATAAKIFPVALVPLGLVHDRRAAGRGLATFAATLLVVAGPFVALAAGGVRFSITRQLGRALQLETLGSSALLALHVVGAYTPHVVFGSGSWNLHGHLADVLGGVQTALQLAAVTVVWILYARGPRTGQRFLLAAATVVSAWISFGKVLSPQFLLWLIPLVALLRKPAPALLLLAALGLTQAVYPSRYDELVALDTLPIVLLAVRNAILLALTGVLVLQLQRQNVLQEVGREGKGAEAGKPVLLDRRQGDGPHGVPGMQPRGGE
jgi:hypothetical protein